MLLYSNICFLRRKLVNIYMHSNHKPGILKQTVYKPCVIIHEIFFKEEYRYGVDATYKYAIHITNIIHINHLK